MNVVWELTAARMKARYRRTLAGFFWVVLSPMITFGAQALIFSKVLKLDVSNYGLYLLGGILPWIFISNSIEMGIPSLVGSRDLMMAYRIRPWVLVFSSIIDNFINFLAGLVLLLIPAFFFYDFSPLGLMLLPLALLQLMVGVTALVWLLSVLNVFFRDTRFVAHFGLSVLFFLTPVFYPRELIPSPYQWLVDINPFFSLIEPVRACLYQFRFDSFAFTFLKGLFFTVGLIAISSLNWKRSQNEFYFNI
jgi:ABC-type polysaccharide/polyol phosphate export permease